MTQIKKYSSSHLASKAKHRNNEALISVYPEINEGDEKYEDTLA